MDSFYESRPFWNWGIVRELVVEVLSDQSKLIRKKRKAYIPTNRLEKPRRPPRQKHYFQDDSQVSGDSGISSSLPISSQQLQTPARTEQEQSQPNLLPPDSRKQDVIQRGPTEKRLSGATAINKPAKETIGPIKKPNATTRPTVSGREAIAATESRETVRITQTTPNGNKKPNTPNNGSDRPKDSRAKQIVDLTREPLVVHAKTFPVGGPSNKSKKSVATAQTETELEVEHRPYRRGNGRSPSPGTPPRSVMRGYKGPVKKKAPSASNGKSIQDEESNTKGVAVGIRGTFPVPMFLIFTLPRSLTPHLGRPPDRFRPDEGFTPPTTTRRVVKNAPVKKADPNVISLVISDNEDDQEDLVLDLVTPEPDNHLDTGVQQSPEYDIPELQDEFRFHPLHSRYEELLKEHWARRDRANEPLQPLQESPMLEPESPKPVPIVMDEDEADTSSPEWPDEEDMEDDDDNDDPVSTGAFSYVRIQPIVANQTEKKSTKLPTVPVLDGNRGKCVIDLEKQPAPWQKEVIDIEEGSPKNRSLAVVVIDDDETEEQGQDEEFNSEEIEEMQLMEEEIINGKFIAVLFHRPIHSYIYRRLIHFW